MALARALGVTPQAVFLWLKKGRVPVARAPEIEALTAGRVTRQALRPDIFGAMTPNDFLDVSADSDRDAA